jgi:hypothetical protein
LKFKETSSLYFKQFECDKSFEISYPIFILFFKLFIHPVVKNNNKRQKKKNKVCIYPNPFSEIASLEVIPFVNQGPGL